MTQIKKRKYAKGNTRTRSRAKFVSLPRGIEFQFRDQSTKFYKRPAGLTNRAMWKKYPIPHVWDNPVPEGDAIVIRKFHMFHPAKDGTYVKGAA